jgi:hypothetical protein
MLDKYFYISIIRVIDNRLSIINHDNLIKYSRINKELLLDSIYKASWKKL